MVTQLNAVNYAANQGITVPLDKSLDGSDTSSLPRTLPDQPACELVVYPKANLPQKDNESALQLPADTVTPFTRLVDLNNKQRELELELDASQAARMDLAQRLSALIERVALLHTPLRSDAGAESSRMQAHVETLLAATNDCRAAQKNFDDVKKHLSNKQKEFDEKDERLDAGHRQLLAGKAAFELHKKSLNFTNTDLSQQLTAANHAKTTLESKLRASITEVKSLQRDKANAASALARAAELQEKNSTLQAENQRLRAQQKKMGTPAQSATNAQKEPSSAQEKLEQFQVQIQKLEKEKAEVEHRLNLANTEVQTLKPKSGDTERVLSEKLQEERANLQAANERLDTLQNEKSALALSEADAQQALSLAQEGLKRLHKRVTQLERTNARLTTENRQIKGARQREEQDFKLRVAFHAGRNRQGLSAQKELERNLERATAEKQTLRASVDNEKARIAEVNASLAILQADVTRLRAEHGQMDQLNKINSTHVQQSQEESRQLRERVIHLEQVNAYWVARVEEKEQALQRKESERQAAISESQWHARKSTFQTNRLNQVMEDNEKTMCHLSEVTQENQTLHAILDEPGQQQAADTRRILENTLTHLTTENWHLRTSMAIEHARIAEVNASLANLQAQSARRAENGLPNQEEFETLRVWVIHLAQINAWLMETCRQVHLQALSRELEINAAKEQEVQALQVRLACQVAFANKVLSEKTQLEAVMTSS